MKSGGNLSTFRLTAGAAHLSNNWAGTTDTKRRKVCLKNVELAGGWRGRLGLGHAREVGEEVVALVVDDDEGREVDHVDLPHGLHAELGEREHVDLADAVLGEARG